MARRAGLALGFTLIEMAIVLVVVGLLISGGLLAVAPVLNGSKAAQTEQKLDRIEQALNLYVIRYGCLPCPADGAAGTTVGLAIGDGGTYSSQCLADNGSATCAVPLVADSVVPWGTLGLSRDDTVDGWGHLISYVVDGNLAVNSSSAVRTGTSTYPTGTLVVQNAGAAPTDITTQAAYVLISHGSDGSGAKTTDGDTIANTIAANATQTDNAAGLCTAGTPCHQDTPLDISGATHFDDVVRWRTAPIIIQLCGKNACGNPA